MTKLILTEKEILDLNNNSQYLEDETIIKLLKYYNSDVTIQSTAECPVAASLDNLNIMLTQVENANVGNHLIVLHVNALDGSFNGGTIHYVGLIINKQTNESGAINYKVQYIDPMGNDIHYSIKEIISNKFPDQDFLPHYNGKLQYAKRSENQVEMEGETHNCGPMLVYLLTRAAHGKTLPKINTSNFNEGVAYSKDTGKELRNIFLGNQGKEQYDSFNLLGHDISNKIDHVGNTGRTVDHYDEIDDDLSNTDQLASALSQKELKKLSMKIKKKEMLKQEDKDSGYESDVEIVESDYHFFPRCEYYTRFQGTTYFNMQESQYWGTYFRSTARGGHCDRLAKNKDIIKDFVDPKLNHKKLLSANSGNFFSPFEHDEYHIVVKASQEQIARNLNIHSVLYNKIIQYKQLQCNVFLDNLIHKNMQFVKVRYVNDYPCIMVKVHSFSFKDGKIEKWHQIAMAYYLAIVNHISFRENVPIELVLRSSFGHNIPSLAETDKTFRINIGLIPQIYTKILVQGIVMLNEAIRRLEEIQIGDKSLLEKLGEKIETNKGYTTRIAEITRSSNYVDYIADLISKFYDGSITELQVWESILDEVKFVEEKYRKVLKFVVSEKNFKYIKTKAIFKAVENAALATDQVFWDIITKISINLRSKALSEHVLNKKILGLYSSIERSNKEFITSSPDYHCQDEGSDSDIEEVNQKFFSRKLTTVTGMKAINLAIFLAQYFCRLKNSNGIVTASLMYYETENVVEAVSDVLSKVFPSSTPPVIIHCIDLNHCSSKAKEEILSEELFQKLPTNEPVILDYTSATTERIKNYVDQCLQKTSLVILLSSGLKNEQMGADINPYGTVRIVAKDKSHMLNLYTVGCSVLVKEPKSTLPPVAHRIRKAYKEEGFVVTNKAIYGDQVQEGDKQFLVTSAHHLYDLWDFVEHTTECNYLLNKELSSLYILSRYNNLIALKSKLPKMNSEMFWDLFIMQDFISQEFLAECLKNDNLIDQIKVIFVPIFWSNLYYFSDYLTLQELINLSRLTVDLRTLLLSDTVVNLINIVSEGKERQECYALYHLVHTEELTKVKEFIESYRVEFLIKELGMHKSYSIYSDNDDQDLYDFLISDDIYKLDFDCNLDEFVNLWSPEDKKHLLTMIKRESWQKEIKENGFENAFNQYMLKINKKKKDDTSSNEEDSQCKEVTDNESVSANDADDGAGDYDISQYNRDSDDKYAGIGEVTGLPIKLRDFRANAAIFSILIIKDLPTATESYRYLLIDSDIKSQVSNREDMDVICLNIQDNTASCGDNALLMARKAQMAGFDTYIYVTNGHAVTLIRYNETLDYTQILQAVIATELKEETDLWNKYLEVMTGKILYLGNSKEAILQEFGKILKDIDTPEEEALGARIETLLVKIDSTNNPELNDLKPILQGLLEQMNESQGFKAALDTNNLETLYNNLIVYITEFADTASESTKTLLQSLLLSIETEFLNPLQSNTNYFSPYYPPGRPDDEPNYGGGSYFNRQDPNDNYAIIMSGNSSNHSMVE